MVDLGSGHPRPLARVAFGHSFQFQNRPDAYRVSQHLRGLPGAVQARAAHQIHGAHRQRRDACLTATQVGQGRVRLALPEPGLVPGGLSVADEQDAGHSRARYPRYARPVAVLRLFAQAREAAGTSSADFDAADVAGVLAAAVDRFGPGFASVLSTCKVWVNGEPAEHADEVGPTDEVAVLPPVSGGT